MMPQNFQPSSRPNKTVVVTRQTTYGELTVPWNNITFHFSLQSHPPRHYILFFSHFHVINFHFSSSYTFTTYFRSFSSRSLSAPLSLSSFYLLSRRTSARYVYRFQLPPTFHTTQQFHELRIHNPTSLLRLCSLKSNGIVRDRAGKKLKGFHFSWSSSFFSHGNRIGDTTEKIW